jgi:hypothetical protein
MFPTCGLFYSARVANAAGKNYEKTPSKEEGVRVFNVEYWYYFEFMNHGTISKTVPWLKSVTFIEP